MGLETRRSPFELWVEEAFEEQDLDWRQKLQVYPGAMSRKETRNLQQQKGRYLEPIIERMGGYVDEKGSGAEEMMLWVGVLEERMSWHPSRLDCSLDKIVGDMEAAEMEVNNLGRLSYLANVVVEYMMLAMTAADGKDMRVYRQEAVEVMAHVLGGDESAYDRAVESYNCMRKLALGMAEGKSLIRIVQEGQY